jgi:hypothetical protein
MNDSISRQALCEYALNQKDKSVTPNDIMRFPSVQPEPCEDTIDRAQAITELQMSAKRLTLAYEAHGEGRVEYSEYVIRLSDAREVLLTLPSVQPEIIHCPDCKYGVHSGCGDRYICTVNYELRMEHDSTFYCGYGKRREE